MSSRAFCPFAPVLTSPPLPSSCLAKSPAMPPGKRLVSEKFRLHVRFPPQSVSISLMGNAWSFDGGWATVLCKTDSSNPAAIIRWKQIRCSKERQCTTSSIEGIRLALPCLS